MLSIAQSENGYYCFEWTPTEKGPRVINYKFFKASRNNLINGFEKVISSHQSQLKDQSNSLSVVLNIKNFNISLMKMAKDDSLNNIIKWYEENILNREYLEQHEMFYYPLNSGQKSIPILILSIKKNIKSDIIRMSNDKGYDLLYMSVDIFSAAMLVKQIYKIKDDENMLVWKIEKNNMHYFAFYENNNLSSLLKFKLLRTTFEIIANIGSNKSLEILKKFIEQTLINNKKNDFIKSTFVYQTKKDNRYMKKIADDKLNIKIIDIRNLFNSSKNNKYHYLPYIENGMSLRGIDV